MNEPFVKYGLMAGTATCALFLLFYFIRPAWMLHPALWWGSLLICMVFMWIAGRRARQAGAGGFRQLMQQVFPVFVVANVLFYAFWYVLLRTDPELIRLQYELLQSRGWEGTIEQLQPTAGQTLLILMQSFIGGAVLSALLAFGLKEE